MTDREWFGVAVVCNAMWPGWLCVTKTNSTGWTVMTRPSHLTVLNTHLFWFPFTSMRTKLWQNRMTTNLLAKIISFPSFNYKLYSPTTLPSHSHTSTAKPLHILFVRFNSYHYFEFNFSRATWLSFCMRLSLDYSPLHTHTYSYLLMLCLCDLNKWMLLITWLASFIYLSQNNFTWWQNMRHINWMN